MWAGHEQVNSAEATHRKSLGRRRERVLGYNREQLNVSREEAKQESEDVGVTVILSSQHLSLLELSALSPRSSGPQAGPRSSPPHGWAQAQGRSWFYPDI